MLGIRPRHVRLRLAELSQNARRSRGEPRDAIGRPGREDSRRFLTRQPDRHIGEREFRKVVKIACEASFTICRRMRLVLHCLRPAAMHNSPVLNVG